MESEVIEQLMTLLHDGVRDFIKWIVRWRLESNNGQA